MRLTRVHVETALVPGGVVELPPDAAAHLAKVLRARVGDELVLFNGDGREFAGEIASLRGARVSVAIGAVTDVDRESPLAVTLVQCVPRGDRMDFIVQKATELGVRRIVPVLSQRSVVRLDGRQGAAKASHWRAVAISACEQCGRNRLPDVDEPRALLDFLGAGSAGDAADGAPLRVLLEPDADPAIGDLRIGASAEVAIGPEGGFAGEEMEAFRIAGFRRVRLGPRVMRTETAAIASLIWLQTRFGDMRT